MDGEGSLQVTKSHQEAEDPVEQGVHSRHRGLDSSSSSKEKKEKEKKEKKEKDGVPPLSDDFNLARAINDNDKQLEL